MCEEERRNLDAAEGRRGREEMNQIEGRRVEGEWEESGGEWRRVEEKENEERHLYPSLTGHAEKNRSESVSGCAKYPS